MAEREREMERGEEEGEEEGKREVGRERESVSVNGLVPLLKVR